MVTGRLKGVLVHAQGSGGTGQAHQVRPGRALVVRPGLDLRTGVGLGRVRPTRLGPIARCAGLAWTWSRSSF